MKIHWTWSVAGALAVVAGAPRAWADVAPPGLSECSTASVGAACQMQTAGTPVGGTCLVSKCGSKVLCTDAAAGNPPECADGGMPGFPGYGLVSYDCLLCNPDAGMPPPPDAPPVAIDPGLGVPSAPAKHGSSGCAVVSTGPTGTGSAWWLGGVLLLGLRRRRSRC
jgi:MYXO-CTERM domain-containing protein